jgi:hypothetical protein
LGVRVTVEPLIGNPSVVATTTLKLAFSSILFITLTSLVSIVSIYCGNGSRRMRRIVGASAAFKRVEDMTILKMVANIIMGLIIFFSFFLFSVLGLDLGKRDTSHIIEMRGK